MIGMFQPLQAGWVLSHCIYTDAKDMKQKCTPKVNSANPVLRSSSDYSSRGKQVTPVNAHRDRRQLPADYNGWLQYTAINTTDSFETFTGIMSVPDLPKEEPQILYLFPGLQNIDWIPKVDKEYCGLSMTLQRLCCVAISASVKSTMSFFLCLRFLVVLWSIFFVTNHLTECLFCNQSKRCGFGRRVVLNVLPYLSFALSVSWFVSQTLF